MTHITAEGKNWVQAVVQEHPMGGTYEDLEVWQAAMDLILKIYNVSKSFPANERYGLTSQLRRAAVSIASNIAEGKGRISDKELLQFLSRTRGSMYEVQTQLKVAILLGYRTEPQAPDLLACATELDVC